MTQPVQPAQQPLAPQPPVLAGFDSPVWQRWFQSLFARVTQSGQIAAVQVAGLTNIGTVSNVIAAATTIPVDTTYAVAAYLKVQSTLTINGILKVSG